MHAADKILFLEKITLIQMLNSIITLFVNYLQGHRFPAAHSPGNIVLPAKPSMA
jgi:hypothetical protein